MRKQITEPVKALEQLQRSLPVLPGLPWMDEDGDKRYPGFVGDISQTPLYVTDGHILLPASAIDPAFEISADDDSCLRKYATEAKIKVFWEPAESREDVAAVFIGCCNYGEHLKVALVRDARGRVMVVSAYLLAFGVRAVRPDALSVCAADIKATCLVRGQEPWFDTPLALRRDGKLVGLLMPMRLGGDDYRSFDLHGEPVSLVAGAQG
jgi:hypothetical protein